MKIQLSKTQWEHIGKIAGWISKQANGCGRLSGDLSDVLEAQVIIGIRKGLDTDQIFDVIKANQSIVSLLASEDVTDTELLECIRDSFRMYMLTAKREQTRLDKKAEDNKHYICPKCKFDNGKVKDIGRYGNCKKCGAPIDNPNTGFLGL